MTVNEYLNITDGEYHIIVEDNNTEETYYNEFEHGQYDYVPERILNLNVDSCIVYNNFEGNLIILIYVNGENL